MVEQELQKLIERIQTRGCEWQVPEVKAAHGGCPERLYDTISSFSNQNSGGTFVFGLDEKQNFKKVGVYDAQDLQKKVMEYFEQMTPIVRPVFTVYDENAKVFVAAEIPPVDVADRPCFKTAKGRLQGSYIRVGEADKPMTEYEIYSYEAFRRKYRDDIRTVDRIGIDALDEAKLAFYIQRRRSNRPNLLTISDKKMYELTGITQEGKVTIAALLLFGLYPQAVFPQLSIIATSLLSDEIGIPDANGNRFSDSKRIEGTLPEMLEGALAFVKNNMRISTKIDSKTGKRIDIPQYPMDAVREAVLNALVHRDYSVHTENMPIQLKMFRNRLEVINPGGLYGRITIDQLGNIQPDTRNPFLVTAMEAIGETENRYSGIPRIRHAMEELTLPPPVFRESRGSFVVTLISEPIQSEKACSMEETNDPKGLVAFCQQPRSRAEIVSFLQISSAQYALRKYLNPLIQSGHIRMTMPEKPGSPKQKYVSANV